MAFYLASTDTAQIKPSATIPVFLSNGCAGSLPILFLRASAAVLAERYLILFKLSGLGNGAVSVFVAIPSAPSQSWRISQIASRRRDSLQTSHHHVLYFPVVTGLQSDFRQVLLPHARFCSVVYRTKDRMKITVLKAFKLDQAWHSIYQMKPPETLCKASRVSGN